MIYLSFAIVAGNKLGYMIPGTVWLTLFAANMFCKEISYRKK